MVVRERSNKFNAEGILLLQIMGTGLDHRPSKFLRISVEELFPTPVATFALSHLHPTDNGIQLS